MKKRTYSWGDRNEVYSVDISPDGRWLAAGAVSEGACVWSLQTVTALSALSNLTAKTIDPVLKRYLKRGTELGCSPLQLRDYFSISSPSMTEEGYSGKRAERIESRYDVVSRKLFA